MHSVCVLYHQNVNLMIDGAHLNADCTDVLDALAFNTNSYNVLWVTVRLSDSES